MSLESQALSRKERLAKLRGIKKKSSDNDSKYVNYFLIVNIPLC